MFFKPDWEEAKQRLQAWWRGEVRDRFAFCVTAPRDKPLADTPVPARPDNPEDFWLDADYRMAVAEHRFATTWFGGEAYPYFDPQLGPGSFALYLGCEPVFSHDTVWYQPWMHDLARVEALRLDPRNHWWQVTRRMIAEGLRRGQGRYLTSLPDLIENLDTIASLRGTAQLLEDLVENGAAIHALQKRVLELYLRCFDELYGMVAEATEGNCFSAFGIWGPGKTAKLQCDFSAMISPAMFEEFVLPYLVEQCARLHFTIYHLDGVEALRHLDLILSIPGLTALQWTPGANQPGQGSPQWFDIYRRARKAGKLLHLLGVEKQEVQPLVEELGPEGLFVGTNAASQAEGEELLAAAEQWTKSSRAGRVR